MGETFIEAGERALVPAFGSVAVQRGARRLEACLTEPRVERGQQGIELRASLRMVVFDRETLKDIKQGEVVVGRFVPGTLDLVWNDTTTAATRALAEAVRVMLERVLGEPEIPEPYMVWPMIDVVHLFATWAAHGAAPPLPNRFPASDPSTAASRIRALKKSDWKALLPRLRQDTEPVLCGFALDGWTILVCMRRDDLDEGRVVVFSPEGERGTLFVNELDGAQSMSALPIDGDTVTLRGVLEWFRKVLRAAKLDKKIAVDEDHCAHGLMLSEWLAFRDREIPRVDFRVQGDSVGEGPLCDGHVPALRTQEGRASANTFFYRKHPLAEVAIYDRFIRTLIDPGFVSLPAK